MKKAWIRRLFVIASLVFSAITSLDAGLPHRSLRTCYELIKVLTTRARQRTVTPFVQVFFPPVDRVQPLLCGLIEEETERIDVEAFQLTSKELAQSLLEAYYRGVEVRVIVNRDALGRFSKVWPLYNAGVPVYVYPQDGTPGDPLMHNKIMLLYSLSCIITGSMNFTNAGMEKNRENLLVIQNEELFEDYTHQFKALAKLTIPLGQVL